MNDDIVKLVCGYLWKVKMMRNGGERLEARSAGGKSPTPPPVWRNRNVVKVKIQNRLLERMFVVRLCFVFPSSALRQFFSISYFLAKEEYCSVTRIDENSPLLVKF